MSTNKYRATVLSLLVLAFSGGLLACALKLGAANPPYAGMIIQQVSGAVALEDQGGQVISGFRIVNHKKLVTVEALAINETGHAVWGFNIRAASTVTLHCVLLNTQGYVSVTRTCIHPEWFPFIHVDTSTNRLYLHLDSARGLTMRINDEIVWQNSNLGIQAVAIDFVTFSPHPITIHFIHVYSAS